MSTIADTPDLSEERLASLMQVVDFLIPEAQGEMITERTVRAMMVKGGTDAQIREALTISAVNARIEPEDKGRYAFGCLRNIMIEKDEAALQS
jgi:hypothetical protein